MFVRLKATLVDCEIGNCGLCIRVQVLILMRGNVNDKHNKHRLEIFSHRLFVIFQHELNVVIAGVVVELNNMNSSSRLKLTTGV